MARPFNLGHEINLHYKDSIILHKEEESPYKIIYVTGTQKLTRVACNILFYKTLKNKKKWSQTESKVFYNLNSKEKKNIFDFSYPFRRCVNIGNMVYIIYRIPERQWTWGLNNYNTVFIESITQKRMLLSTSDSSTIPFLYNTFFPTYYNLEEAFNKCVTLENKAAAITPEIYLTPCNNKWRNNKAFVHYKRTTMGILDDNLKLKIPKKLEFLKIKIEPLFSNAIKII